MIRIRTMMLAAALASAAAFPAMAQNNQDSSGLVTVNVSDVANNLAQNLKVNVSQIPVTVQVPVGIAANVCGVDANVLAQQKGSGGATCDAASTSKALDQAVQRQLITP